MSQQTEMAGVLVVAVVNMQRGYSRHLVWGWGPLAGYKGKNSYCERMLYLLPGDF